jgi:hypothetical protein
VICGPFTQGDADFVSLVLGYLLPGFQPFCARRVGDRRSVQTGFHRVPSAKMVVWV